MSGINPCSEFEFFSDNQLLDAMLKNDNAHSCIYLRHKTYCIKFMLSKGVSENDVLDIYQDATIILYEKVKKGDFNLTSKLQVYLNTVCWYQFLARIKSKHSKVIFYPGEIDETIANDFTEGDELKNEMVEHLLNELSKMKENGNKCDERLRLFYYEKLTMDEIAKRLEFFGGAVSARNQIYKCREDLKIIFGAKK
jgi:DNA-directed RNA polymerase specialized sigma24 family protein